jgi:hypothetical protein
MAEQILQRMARKKALQKLDSDSEFCAAWSKTVEFCAAWSKTVLPAFPPFEQNFVRIEESFHKSCRLTGQVGDLVLYRRPAFDAEIRFCRQQIMAEGFLGWILGPPGTGKSVAGFAFAASVDRAEWTVIWLKLSDLPPLISIFEGNQQYTAYTSYEFVRDFLGRAGGSQKCLLIVDGFLKSNIQHDQTGKDAQFWRIRDEYNHRLIIISSMSSRSILNDGEDRLNRVKEHLVPSWTLREYFDAFRIPDLHSSVSSFLDSPPGNSVQGLQELIKQKFFYAGGSARYMFQFALEDVTESLDKALVSIPSKPSEGYFMMSSRAGNAVNSLVALYPSCENKRREIFVSAYVRLELSKTVTSSAMRSILRTVKDDVSGSGAGSMLEILFCTDLCSGNLKLTFRNGSSVLFTSASIRKVDMKMSDSIKVKDEEWLKPEAETNPGFDLVYINPQAEFVRFVQLTRSHQHKLNLTPCKLFIDKLTKCKIKIVEFCFVVNKENLKEFKVIKTKKDTVQGRGALTKYRLANDRDEQYWVDGSEETQVTVAGMDDIFP